MLYALIITIHPSIDTCNNILVQPQNYHFNNIWTNTLIIKLTNLTNPPERHILTPHPYTTFMENNEDIILPKNSIHTEIYEFIHNQDTTSTPTTLQSKKIPFLLNRLITKAFRCLENINEYSHPPPLPATLAPITKTNTNIEHETNIITWNASSLNTSLPNLQSLINNTPNNTSIIYIEQTKLSANKSTKYIQNVFPGFKLIFIIGPEEVAYSHLSTRSMHSIRKTIYIAQHDPLWQAHPILNDIRNHQHTNIPHPPITTTFIVEWIDAIADIAKTANKKTKKITTKYTKDYILKVVSKYRQMYDKNPQKINRKVFKNIGISPMDFNIDRQNYILTNPEDIAS